MKRAFAGLLMAILLSAAAPAGAAAAREFVTGDDWKSRMSPREKFMSLSPPALLFSEYDVHLKLSLPQYVLLIDKVMEHNPQLGDEEVSSIFASTIYLFEPQNRPALKRMEMDFLRGDYESEALPEEPRLTLEDVLPETVEAES